MMSSRTVFLHFSRMVFVVSAFMGVACDLGSSSTNPRPSCPPDGGPCGVITTGGGSNSSGSGGSGGEGTGGSSSATNDVEGSVGVLNEESFTTVAPYLNDAMIFTTSTSGMAIDTLYSGATPKFTLPSVMNGATWFFVQDQTNGASGIFSTHSVVNVPVSGPVTLPVVDRNVIQAIVSKLPAPIVLDIAKTVLVMKIVRNGQPLPGVTLSTTLPGAEIIYDTGIGLYSNQTKQTGSAGVILALNVTAPSNVELSNLSVVDSAGLGFVIQVRMQAGTASFAGYELN